MNVNANGYRNECSNGYGLCYGYTVMGSMAAVNAVLADPHKYL